MNKRTASLLSVFVVLIGLLYAGYYQYTNSVKILKLSLSSPDNSALKSVIDIELNNPAPVFVEYWKAGTSTKFRTPTSKKQTRHSVQLLLLEPGSTYEYVVVVNRLMETRSGMLTFQTREASPWMVHNWIKEASHNDEKALGDGLVMLCHRGYPGYVAMVDGVGTIRWYWQDEKLGVRLATLTPRNTILALLAPAGQDEFYKMPVQKKTGQGTDNTHMRTGKIGFVGGTEMAEIDLTGKVMWRLKLQDRGIVFHHDLKMNDKNQIVSIYRDPKLYDLDGDGIVQDTLWGDGVMVMDTTGKVLKKWSGWDGWDLKNDKNLVAHAQDRFHFNAVSFDRDGNYLVSTPIENQIWKVNSVTGKIIWKLGKGGDFAMDSNANFHFQHYSYINRNGDLMLFDNGDFSPNDTTKVNKISRALSFKLDTVAMKAKLEIVAPLPGRYYTARMGSAFLMDNNNILHTSSKTGGVVVTDQRGKLVWQLNSHFIPYRAEYVPASTWATFIKHLK